MTERAENIIPRHSRFLFFYVLLLIIPALFLNLGLMPFILDEATRANVALEMMHRGNFIVPTINGEFYYNKPPLFNWIQIFFVSITGDTDEIVFRLPTVTSLLLFAFTIYQTQKKESSRKVAFFTALAFLTCGRILFYDSFRGLIDITFSWVIYLVFWFIYYYGKRKEYLNLFMLSYLLAAVGFLMKGLPALVFLSISLLAWFIYSGKFKKLFSWQHLAGFGLLVIIIGGYLITYNRYNSPLNFFETLWTESSKRTFLDNTIWDSISHLVLFPLDFIYHFLPWTLLLLIFFWKKCRQEVSKNSFAKFSLLIFGANIIIYWLSPAIYPRYLFMFLPLLFFIIFNSLDVMMQGKKERRWIDGILLYMSLILVAGMVFIPVLADRDIYQYFILKYILVLIFAAPLVYLLLKKQYSRILIFTGFLLVARIAFNWFVIPDRIEHGTDLYQKNGAKVAAELSGSRPLYLLDDTRIHHVSTFYIMTTRGQILERWEGLPDPGSLYIAEKPKLYRLPPHHVLFSFETRIEGLKLCLIEF